MVQRYAHVAPHGLRIAAARLDNLLECGRAAQRQMSSLPAIVSSALTHEDLKQHLKDGRFSSEWLFQVYVIQKRSHLFSLLPDGINEEMEFRRDIANMASVALNEVCIVGSAQVGFSIKPGAGFTRMDETYAKTKKLSDKSDVDVAIVSPRYFEKLQDDLRDFTKGFREVWQLNAYYPDASRLGAHKVKRVDYLFYQYLARGWIRPDFAPDAFKFGFDLALTKWSRKLNRRVGVGIYREWKNLRDYQAGAFERLRELALKGGL